jgi:cysteine desulfurase
MIGHINEVYGNPSSQHQIGDAASTALAEARGKVAALLHAKPEEIVFCSGGTESVNHAIKGVAWARRDKGRHIITSNIEHKSVLSSLRALKMMGWDLTSLDVDKHGLLDPTAVEKAIREDTVLISIMHANNEIGTMEPIAEIGRIARERKIPFHSDAVASAGVVPIDVQALNVDLLSIAANQFCGPAGVGALYVRRGTPLWPLLDGGPQENNKRAGTANLLGIVGMGKAAELALKEMDQRLAQLKALRQRLIDGLRTKISHVIINGHPDKCLPHLVSASVSYIEGESMMLLLDEEGICVSTRSACASGSLRASHVLLAIGMDFADAQGTMVLTLGRENTAADVDLLLEKLPPIVDRLRAMSPIYKG